MSWLTRLLGNHADDDRLRVAEGQRDEAAALLRESRSVSRRVKDRVERNYLTEGFAEAFERRSKG